MIFKYAINKDNSNLTIEKFLKNLGYSKHLIIHLKNTDMGITIDNQLKYITYILKEGDHLRIKLEEKPSSSPILSTKMDIDIVYEDSDLLVINKTAGIPVHPSMGNHENTLANGLSYYFHEKNPKKNDFVFRCINRLDRDTSGLMIVAKHMLSSCILSDMVKNKKIEREYLAIATGKVPDSGVIDAPIARAKDSILERVINFESGAPSITHYRCLEYKNGYSLVSLKLETGRTHQIRVHMKYIGHPLPGDFIYYPDFTRIKRQALHSHKLSFNHPISNQKLEFAVPLPEDMNKLIQT